MQTKSVGVSSHALEEPASPVPLKSPGESMTRIELPAELVEGVGRALKMDFHLVDVRLKDGRLFSKLAVRGGRYITGRESDPNFEGLLPFDTDDIANMRPTARVLGRLWPFWPTAR